VKEFDAAIEEELEKDDAGLNEAAKTSSVDAAAATSGVGFGGGVNSVDGLTQNFQFSLGPTSSCHSASFLQHQQLHHRQQQLHQPFDQFFVFPPALSVSSVANPTIKDDREKPR